MALAGTWAIITSPLGAAAVRENFATDPRLNGWQTVGNGSLFQWNATEQNLAVTWDSRTTNSYFTHPLGAVLDQRAAFRIAFDLTLSDIRPGVDPANPNSFQVAIGLMNLAQATQPGFRHGTGSDAPNLVEWNYYPAYVDEFFGPVAATVASACISRSNEFAYTFVYRELATNQTYRVTLAYEPTNATLTTTVLQNHMPWFTTNTILATNFAGFQVDHVAILSYSGEGQYPGWGGSVLAHGTVDNLAVDYAEAHSPALRNQAEWTENFAAQPELTGWQMFGDRSLFHWNPDTQALEATWDSRQPNSYCYRPLGNTLGTQSDFQVAFDLTLRDIAVGIDPNNPNSFEVTVGLFNLAAATRPTFRRGTGYDSPNLVEFDYFPAYEDAYFGPVAATFSTTLISSNSEFGYSFVLQEMATNQPHRITITHTATNRLVTTVITRNGQLLGQTNVILGPNFPDFRVDTLGILSYSGEGQWPGFGGSVLAHGTVDNLAVRYTALPAPQLAPSQPGRVECMTRRGLLYRLERTTDGQEWTAVAERVGDGQSQTLLDPAPPAGHALYRVRAVQP